MSKRIVITGASRGIGNETSKRLAELGHQVIAISRSKDLLNQLKDEYPSNIEPLALDITDSSAGETISQYLSDNSVKIDGLIHNAGVLINKPFSEQTRSDWQKQFEVNLMAPALLTKDLHEFFNSGSHIITISSMGGYQGSSKFPGLSVYSATKGGLSILTECIATEFSDKNISCNSLCLGAVQTEMLEQAFPGIEAPVEPEEIAEYISEFILNGHKFYNGQILPVTLGDPG
ncbi:SDR family oxidoreductase [Rhodohalobacter sp.]|uniref:SDR family NAD(P)-dependent oxidoreductase n=1 Tax=Rhodohalobacter sp. TaxID=1974210 RepID=UPI002ACE6C42|nr:SDR family oxidoreductase [Rhodohalobacter sp.]MDZ7756626.1 SDR family oxidoreductase [Rhodohalobacter sp.]